MTRWTDTLPDDSPMVALLRGRPAMKEALARQVDLDVEAGLGGARLGDARVLEGLAGDGADHPVAAEAVDLLEGDHRVEGLAAELAVGRLDLVAELAKAVRAAKAE